MNILAIDTTSKYLSLAIAKGEKVVASFHKIMDQRQCEELLPQIDKLLKKSKLKLRDIDYIVFSKGPGSLTALRIGAATVKGLALATKIKIVSVPTLDLLAYAQGRSFGQSEACPGSAKKGTPFLTAKGPSLIVPMVDARRGNVYSAVYSFKNGKLRRKSKYSVAPPAEVLKSVKGDAIFLGDGLVAYRKFIEDNFKYKPEFAAENDWYPLAETLIDLGCEAIKGKKFEEADKFIPMYLYPKDVQVRDMRK